jgi:hypothetical protein
MIFLKSYKLFRIILYLIIDDLYSIDIVLNRYLWFIVNNFLFLIDLDIKIDALQQFFIGSICVILCEGAE